MRRVIAFLLVMVMLGSMVPMMTLEADAASYDVINVRGVTGEDIVAKAREYLGVPYGSNGGDYKTRTGFGNPMMFDCSGFVYRVCREVGLASSRKNYTMGQTDNNGNPLEGQDAYGNYYITAHTQEQRYYGENISSAVKKYMDTGDYSDLQSGDLLFVTSDNSNVSHVVIYAGNGKIIHCEGYEGCVAEHSISRYSYSNTSNWFFDGCRLIDESKLCMHIYEGAGVCSSCGYDFDWESTFDASTAGVYEIVKSFTPRTDKPYNAATEANFCTIPGAEVNVLGSYTNAYENKWYVYESNGENYYVYEDYLTFVGYGEQEISCTITSPKEGATVPRESYPVAGTVTSKYPIQKVEAYIDGKWYATVTLGNQTTLDIRTSDINYDLDFATLDPGSHSLVLRACDIHHDTLELIIRRNFVTEGEVGCAHSYNSSVTAPTCTAQGYTTYTCQSCGYSYNDNYTDMKAHSYGDWTTVTTATCTADGMEKRTCSACGKVAERTVNAYGHRYTDSVTQPSCTDKGYTTHVCANCGDSYVDSYVDALNHSYESKEINATCVEYAKIQYTCTKCGHSYVDTAGDGYSEWSEIKPSGIDESLIESRTEYSYRTKEFATSSSETMNGWTQYGTSTQWGEYGAWSNWSDSAVSESDSTEVETRKVYGYYYYLCSNCGAHMHGYGTCYTWAGGCGAKTTNSGWHEIWSTTSWDNAGLKDWHGTGKYYTYIDGELVFKWPEGGSKTQYRYCTRQQETVYHFYKWSEWSAWTTDSVWITENQESATRVVYRYVEAELGDHKYIAEVFEPTCTAQGYTKYTCEYCGDWYHDDYLATLKHDYDYIITKKPTVNAAGVLTGTCATCGDTVTESLPKLNKEDYTYTVTKEPSKEETGTAKYTWNTTQYGEFSFETTLDKLPDVLLGDVNGDGQVSVLDLMRLANYFANGADINAANADVNCDGAVTVLDLMRLANYFAGNATLG